MNTQDIKLTIDSMQKVHIIVIAPSQTLQIHLVNTQNAAVEGNKQGVPRPVQLSCENILVMLQRDYPFGPVTGVVGDLPSFP
jgi:hypothetical protein